MQGEKCRPQYGVHDQEGERQREDTEQPCRLRKSERGVDEVCGEEAQEHRAQSRDQEARQDGVFHCFLA